MARLSTNELSARIKAGVARARRAGKRIGAHGQVLAALHRAQAAARTVEMLPTVDEFHGSGLSYRHMIVRLNQRREPTPSGTGAWHVKTLQRLVERARALDPLVRRSAAALAEARALRALHRARRSRTAAMLAESRVLCVAHLATRRRGAALMADAHALEVAWRSLRPPAAT